MHTETCTRMFRVALFLIAKSQNSPNVCHLMSGWDILTMELLGGIEGQRAGPATGVTMRASWWGNASKANRRDHIWFRLRDAHNLGKANPWVEGGGRLKTVMQELSGMKKKKEEEFLALLDKQQDKTQTRRKNWTRLSDERPVVTICK